MNRQRGFTLLEMLAAIALLVIAASVLLGAFAQSGRSLQQVARADRQHSAARSLIDDIDLGTLEPGQQRGRWHGLPWTVDVSLAAVPPGRVTLYRLDLTVGEGRYASHYSTLRARTSEAPK
ncbi:general secretion pathway protein GspI [Pseudomonas sp. LB-090624]|uniref:prepilin-type N-terminal cleavage/methylation domain-containing protein n=1 Tax=Pseudomonas sp. LB-090624 TaxID=2213079 RepID=UPI000D981EBA|nr:prepilin-type N-terminal cleavage/methylation domain-containing protein [Pseudomonas sp. LB-090624]PYB80999.1 general secretion pathway protein GspI [Pseudomonas sp. LB-090624]